MDFNARVTQSASSALAALRISSSMTPISSSSTTMSEKQTAAAATTTAASPAFASGVCTEAASFPINRSANATTGEIPRPMTASSTISRSIGSQRRQSERPGPELGAAPAQMEAWKRALRADFHGHRKGRSSVSSGSSCGSRASVSASAAISLAAKRISRTAGMEISRPHATRPHQPELALPPPPETLQPPAHAAVVEDTVNTTNAVYGHCKPRETFSRVGLRPSTEYVRVMERLDTARARAREASRRSATLVGDSTPPSCPGTSGGRRSTAQKRISGTADSNATSICLFGVAIEEDEIEDDFSADGLPVGQAASMVFSLERPEESTLEVLQLEVDRQSEAGDGNGDFDETELHLYRIQPRENPHPID